MTRHHQQTRHPRADTSWMADAACVEIPGLPWVDDPRGVRDFVRGLLAEVCASCPVLDRCRRFVDDAGISAGYWAGEYRDSRPDESSKDEGCAA